MRTYPRSGFCSGGTSAKTTLVPVFVPGEHPPNHPFGKLRLCESPKKGTEGRGRATLRWPDSHKSSQGSRPEPPSLEDLIFCLACSVHFVRGRFGQLLWDSVEIAQNRRPTKCTEQARQKIGPSKRQGLYIFQTFFCQSHFFGAPKIANLRFEAVRANSWNVRFFFNY